MTVAQTDDPVKTRPGPRRSSWLGALPRRVLPVALTLLVVGLAIVLGRLAWNAYIGTPWTRDGTVRAYVITLKPEVSGRVVEVPIRADQFVHKGDSVLQIDRTDYEIAVKVAQAAVQQAEATVDNARLEAQRRRSSPPSRSRSRSSRPTLRRRASPWPALPRRPRTSSAPRSTSSARRSCRRSTASSPIWRSRSATMRPWASGSCRSSMPTVSGSMATSRRRSCARSGSVIPRASR